MPSFDAGHITPSFDLTINGNRISAGVRSLITRAEYESVDGMADVLKLNIQDPVIDGVMKLRESKLFMPGNEISLWGGYGRLQKHLGRAVVRRMIPDFPRDGTPAIQVVGYTADSLMMDSEPEPLRETKTLKKGGVRVKNSSAGRRWTEAKYSDAVRDRGQAYGFELDVDDTLEPPSEFNQKAGMRDFQFIQALANLSGFVFWVDGAADGTWTLHFKNPDTLDQADLQEKEYNFRYNQGDLSTLLEFRPELALQESITKLIVQSTDPLTGLTMEAKVEETAEQEGDLKVATGNVRGEVNDPNLADTSAVAPTKEPLEGPLNVATEVQIFIEEYSFSVQSSRRFRSEAQLAAWAAAWFRRNRENFLLANGRTIGVESLRARQQHKLTGLGKTYSGLYYFSRVSHIFEEGGYTVDFSARKIVPRLPPVTSASELQVEELLQS